EHHGGDDPADPSAVDRQDLDKLLGGHLSRRYGLFNNRTRRAGPPNSALGIRGLYKPIVCNGTDSDIDFGHKTLCIKANTSYFWTTKSTRKLIPDGGNGRSPTKCLNGRRASA